MAVWPGKHIARPQAQIEPITIPLTPAASGDLQRPQSGRDLIVRDRRTGEAQLVRFL